MTTVSGSAITERFRPYREAVDNELAGLRPFSTAKLLDEAMAYAVFPGGKRLRAILALAAGEIFNGKTAGVRPVAAAVELLHSASLVLDDLPVMDNAPVRRGKEALHHAYSPETAILCAHSLVSFALHLITRTELDDAAVRKILSELLACIGPTGMAGGQSEDLLGARCETDGPEEQRRIASLKTGSLFMAAGYCGAVAGGADEGDALMLGEYGLHLGTAYQILDDLRDSKGEDDPGRSANVASTCGHDQALALLECQLTAAQRCAEEFSSNAILIDLITWMKSNV